MSAVTGGETQQALVAPGVKPPLAVPRRLLRMRSDATLAERFAAGDEAAFDVIYERHRPVVLAVCMGVLGTPADAEDATQETFSALAVALRTRPPAELRPWLIRVARNASIDTTRRRRNRLLTLDGEIPEVAARPHGSGQAELAVVLDGIRELPEGQRMALLMRELGGHSYAEIAEFLATDEEAVKGLIARARVGLRTYREATELSCATARDTIAAEPDGRRYDKTIRRHLRGCSSCRGYREALRDDAKALRAALPIQAGTVATGSLSGGLLSAAKGSLLSYGLTQAATTCAASACAVGAIGGMVFVAPVHKLGLFPILPARSSAPAHRHPVRAKLVQHHTVAAVSHATEQASTAAPQSSARSSAASSAAPTATHKAITHRHRSVHVTRVVLPPLHKHHPHAGAPAQTAVAPASDQGQSAVNQTPASTAQNPGNGNGSQGPGNGNGSQGPGHGNGNAYGSWKTAAQNSAPQASPATSPASSTQSSPAPSPQFSSVPSPAGQTFPGNGNHGQGNGHGRWGGNPRSGNPHGPTASAAAAAPGQTAAPAAATTATTTTSPLPATTTSVTTATTPAPGWGGPGHGHGWGNGHGNWSQSAPAQPAASAPASPVNTSTPTTSTTAAGWSGNGWSGNGHGWGHSR